MKSALGRGFLSILFLAGVAVLLYSLWGHALIGAMYREEAWSFLNDVVTGRDIHPVSYYTDRADKWFYKLVLGGSLFSFLILFMVLKVLPLGGKFFKHAWIQAGASALVSLSVGLLLCEGILRLLGFQPWVGDENALKVVPGGRLVQVDNTVGYVHIPGTYQVQLPTGYTFQLSHEDEGRRVTSPVGDLKKSDEKPEIWIFGCSFTHGWSLNDNETFAWHVQEAFPDYRVKNFGTIGYGTIQALIQFEELLKQGKRPATAIYVYASFHDVRNTFLRKRRKSIGANNQLGPFLQPFARLNDNGEIVFERSEVVYKPFPFMKQSALVHLVEQQVNEAEDKAARSHLVTERLLDEFQKLARQYEVDIRVAGIDQEADEFLKQLEGKGIPTFDISVDLSGKENRNWPHDSHPNAKAHRIYGDKMIHYLEKQGFRKQERHEPTSAVGMPSEAIVRPAGQLA